MKISEIIGQKVELIKYDTGYDRVYDLQHFEAYWKLSNGVITIIPTYPDFNIANIEEITFNKSSHFDSSDLDFINTRVITDVYFSYFNDELEDDEKAYFELDNSIYVTQNSFAPDGVNHTANLKIYSTVEFKKLQDDETVLKSIRKKEC